MRRLVIDADIAAFVSSVNRKDQPETTFEMAIAGLKESREFLQDFLKADELTYVLSDSTTFRHIIFPQYKANRAGQARPSILGEVRQWLRDEYGAYHLPFLEADDTMAIEATMPREDGVEVVLVSIDKDMRQVPGLLFNPNKWQEGVIEITEESARYAFYRQVLMGDSTDNISGCPTIGPKKAEKLIEGCVEEEDYWKVVAETYAKHQLPLEYAVTQARLVRLLRYQDYDLFTEEIGLWLPNGEREVRSFP